MKTKYYQRLHPNNDRDEASVQCLVCPRLCVIGPGRTGSCQNRTNIGGELILTTAGRTSALRADPVEKKPLYHFIPGHSTLSFGTIGCNLSCDFCQNYHLSQGPDAQKFLHENSPAKIVQIAQELECRSIAFTYNEPVVFMEFALEVATLAHQAGLKTIAVSAGHINPLPCLEFFSAMDAVNIDLKSFNPEFYQRYTRGSLSVVLETLTTIYHKLPTHLEITTLVIPEKNDSSQEIHALATFVARELGPDVPLHFAAFHPEWKMYEHYPTPLATLLEARATAQSAGLRYVYCGNVDHDESAESRCPHCAGNLVQRLRPYKVRSLLAQDRQSRQPLCSHCQTPVAFTL